MKSADDRAVFLKFSIPTEKKSVGKKPETGTYFVPTPHGFVEKDYRIVDRMVPTLGGREHPYPQHWHELFYQAKKREKFGCALCYRNDRLDLHHRTYERWGHELLSDVICLCRRCHQKFHDIDRPAERVILPFVSPMGSGQSTADKQRGEAA